MYYDWDKTFSYQTGTQGEICLVAGGKNIGKTFGLRKKCIERFIKCGELFVDISRTLAQVDGVMGGYFSKLQNDGFFPDYIFKTEKACGYIARKPANEDDGPEWQLICYFVALSNFQNEKTRTYVKPRRFIFDEAILDKRDRYHRYLPDEYFILANLLDTISRQQPGDDYRYNVYLLGNSVDFTCPYFRYLGINKVPDRYGYSYHREKTVLFHYVEPMNADDRKTRTLVGRMLAGYDEAETMFDNKFIVPESKEISKKSANAKYSFAIRWQKRDFGIWIDYKRGIWYVTEKVPRGATNIYVLTKRDGSIDYTKIGRASPMAKLVAQVQVVGGLRYESAFVREAFFEILSFLGVK